MNGRMRMIATAGRLGVTSSCLITCISFVQRNQAPKRCPPSCKHGSSWASKRIAREVNVSRTVWQEEFFDHVSRSSESYGQKWDYVKENPARAGFVKNSYEWP